MKKNIDIKNLKVAKRYALALRDSAIDVIDEVNSDMHLVDEVIFSNEDFKTFFSHPIVSLKDKKETIQETLEGKIHQTTLNFLLTLLDENRFFVFKTIFELFKKDVEDIKNKITIDVTSAVELETDEKENLRNKLATKLSKDVILTCQIDKDILGGLVVKHEDDILDLSLRTHFDVLRKSIIK